MIVLQVVEVTVPEFSPTEELVAGQIAGIQEELANDTLGFYVLDLQFALGGNVSVNAALIRQLAGLTN